MDSDGLSIVPLLKGQDQINRDAIFWHFPHYHHRAISPYGIVRAGPWKMIRWWEGFRHELYASVSVNFLGLVAVYILGRRWIDTVSSRATFAAPAGAALQHLP